MTETRRKYLILEEPAVASAYGIPPRERPLDMYLRYGCVVIDKPMGPTSHQVTAWVKDILHIDRTGHIGTLDPNVTGVLPILLSSSTKIAKPLQGSDKEYVGIMRLHRDIDSSKVRKVIGEFQGPIYQMPPVRSAVKRALRVREIKSLSILEVKGRDYLVRVQCEGGTYIRTLFRDIGLVLGTGANMQELRRTKSSGFTEKDLITLHDLKDSYEDWMETGDESWLRENVRPVEDAVSVLKRIYLKDTAVNSVCYGASLSLPGISRVEATVKKGDQLAMFTEKNELIGIGTALMDAQEMYDLYEKGEEHGFSVKPVRIIMDRDTYPRVWKKKKVE